MFSNLGIVREAISDTELKVLSIGEGKAISTSFKRLCIIN